MLFDLPAIASKSAQNKFWNSTKSWETNMILRKADHIYRMTRDFMEQNIYRIEPRNPERALKQYCFKPKLHCDEL